MASLEVNITNSVATIEFNRPESLNALNVEVIEALKSALLDITPRTDVRVILLRGAGAKAFVAGADIKQMKEMSPIEASHFARLGQDTLFMLESAPQITIAQIQGFALGGGCEVAMACDLIYASTKATFGQPEVNLGVIPGFGGTQRLLRLVGPMKAKEWVFTGKMVSAQDAYNVGLVAEVLEPDQLESHVQKIISTLLQKGPEALRRAKEAMRIGKDLPLENACAYEREMFSLCFAHEDQKEGMEAFLEKRQPKWK